MTPWQSSGHTWTSSGLCRLTFSLLTVSLAFSLLSSVHARSYFLVNQPSSSTSWANDSPYPFSWTKGLLDGLDTFDVELIRLHQDGLILVAHNVPASYKALNILLHGVPAGDDYFLVCFNASQSIVYAVSPRFTITDGSSGQSNPSPNPSVPTVTAYGPPNPLSQFAATLGPAVNAGNSLIFPGPASRNLGPLGFGGILALCAAFLGGAMTLW